MKQKILIISLIAFSIIATFVIANMIPNHQSFESKRDRIINDMHSTIQHMSDNGKYHCCIEPACTMCFLGNWHWDDGICRCDDMIAQGKLDEVCPQCQRGLEQGLCKTSESTVCEI